MAARGIELASVSFTLVLACRDGLGSGPVVLAAIGLVLSGSEHGTAIKVTTTATCTSFNMTASRSWKILRHPNAANAAFIT